jgi:hypothetical protein
MWHTNAPGTHFSVAVVMAVGTYSTVTVGVRAIFYQLSFTGSPKREPMRILKHQPTSALP